MPDVADDVDEHPIIFNEWSIRRILAGEKTQTRRVTGLDDINEWPDIWTVESKEGKAIFRPDNPNTNINSVPVTCPYGQPGDVLWLREAFRLPERYSEMSPREYVDTKGHRLYYRMGADGTAFTTDDSLTTWHPEWGRKRPSIHMPRELCRLRLRVEDVRVELVQKISGEDVAAEGVSPDGLRREAEGRVLTDFEPQEAFKALWQDIHGEDAWEENPWVWVIDFKRID